MHEYFRTLYALNLGYCKALLRDIDEDQMHLQPTADVNPPAWLLGHLAICTDYTLELLGKPRRLPEAWHDLFGLQTVPQATPGVYPTKQELWEAHAAGHEAVAAATEHVASDLLAQPNPLPFEFLTRALPTVGELVAHMMTTHEASHLGHLSNWRRQTGRPPLF